MRKTRSISLALFLLGLTSFVRAQVSDVSDAVFSIVVPSAEAQVVDMGALPVGAQRDSLVQPFIRNTGRTRIRIDGLHISGGDASAFDVIAGKAPVFVPANDGHTVGFAFHPMTPGLKSATIVVETQVDTLYYEIRGEATAPQIALEVTMIDFGQLPVGAHRDSSVALIRNLTAGPVTVTSAEQAGPDRQQFTTVSGDAPFALVPYGTHEMVLRFEAKKGGRSSGSIVFGIDGSTDLLAAQLFGEGIVRDATATLATDTLTAAPGEIVRIPIRLRNAVDVQFTGASAFTTELRYRASLLVPFGATPEGRLEGDERVIPLDNLPLIADEDGVLDSFDFIAVLGDEQTTELKLQNSAAIGALFPVLESPGMFRLTDICREGGDRLFDASAALQLQQQGPNPFNAATVLRFTTIEKGAVQLYVLDLLGQRIRTLVDGQLEPGSYERILDLQTFPSGTYICVLQTATLQKMLRIQLLK